MIFPGTNYPQVVKDPNEVISVPIDWSRELGSDSISTAAITVPSGITLDTTSTISPVVTAWLSGGTIDTDYDVLCRMVSVGGLTLDFTFTVAVRAR